MSAVKQVSKSRALDKIEREGAKPKPQPSLLGLLPRAEIHTVPAVFQPRTFSKGQAEREAHVQHLMKAIRSAGAKDYLLDPVLVWWSGKRWVVVDGHHRLEAYERLEAGARPLKVLQVAAEALEGQSLREAIAEATRRNSRANLQMTTEDRSESAWRMVAMRRDPPFTISEIAEAASTSERNVGNMRKALRELWGGPERAWDSEQVVGTDVPADPLDMSWRDVRRLRTPTEPWSDDQVAAQARAYAARLTKEFGPKLGQNPTIAAMALEIHSPHLVRGLVEYWGSDADDLVEEDEDDCEAETHGG